VTREEQLIAYVDSELDGKARARFEAEMAADPALAEQVAQHRKLAGRVSDAYAPVLDEPMPLRLSAAAMAANDRAPPRFGLPQWAAMAACLVAGVLVGRVVVPHGGPLVTRDGELVAQGALAKALTANLAAQETPVKVGLSFRTADGGYCRTFQSAPDRLAGLACRRDGRWVAQTLAAWRPGASPEYRMAGSDTPPEVLAAVDRLIAGEPLDAAAERAARDRDWQD
jgi:hypothetical protein